MCERATFCVPGVVLKYVGGERRSCVAVVVVGVVTGEVVGDVVNELKVNGRPHETGKGGQEDSGTKESPVVPSDSSL